MKKRQRRLTGVNQIVLSLSARGLTTGEISAHFAEVYGASVSRETVSQITDPVLDEMTAWMNRCELASAGLNEAHRTSRGTRFTLKSDKRCFGIGPREPGSNRVQSSA